MEKYLLFIVLILLLPIIAIGQNRYVATQHNAYVKKGDSTRTIYTSGKLSCTSDTMTYSVRKHENNNPVIRVHNNKQKYYYEIGGNPNKKAK